MLAARNFSKELKHPSGLKPTIHRHISGTDKPVPFQKTPFMQPALAAGLVPVVPIFDELIFVGGYGPEASDSEAGEDEKNSDGNVPGRKAAPGKMRNWHVKAHGQKNQREENEQRNDERFQGGHGECLVAHERDQTRIW